MEIVIDVVETAIDTTTPAETTDVSTQATDVNSEVQTPATETPVADPSVDPAAQQAAPVYTPDFKVKIKGKEHEIPEMFRGLIKDQETEKQVKEFVEKALGIDSVKQDRATIKEQFEGFKKEITPYLEVYDQFTQLRDSGNLGAAFKVAGISDEQIFEYAIQRLEMEKNPVLAKTYESQQSQSLKELELQRKVAMYEQQNQLTSQQAAEQELEQSMSANEALVNQVNAKVKDDGFFMQEVIAYAAHQHSLGKSVSPGQAVSAVVNKYQQFFPASTPQQAAPVAPQATQAAAPKTHQAPHTIPNVGNSTGSPVKKRVASIDDIRKAAQEANRAG
jgi:hypothetical protein